jgi:ribokinase
MPRVVVIGSTNLDFTVVVPRLPQPGETVSGGDLVVSPGGKGANQAVAARRLGADVRFVTLVGTDVPGDRVLAALTAAGLPTDGLLRTEAAATGVALIVVDAEGRNQIAVAPGANHRLTPERAASRADALAWADVVLLQLETPIETVRWALQEARRLGKTTVLNPAPARVLPLPPDLLPLVDYLTPNEHEASLLTGRAVESPAEAEVAGRALLAAGVGTAVVTLGAAGAVAVGPGGCIHATGFTVSPVDTVGAGDAFAGALAVLLGARAPVREALDVANAAGALACTRRGAMESLPDRAEVQALLAGAGRSPRTDW